VVPVYNSLAVEELAERVHAALSGLPVRYELILVDDLSPDPRVWPVLERLAATRPNVRAIQLTRNFGQQAATLCGLRESRGDVVITMDDDLQHSPEDLRALLRLREHDIVIGQLVGRQHGIGRRLASWAKGYFDQWLIGKPKGIQLSSFRLLGRTVVDGVLAIRTPNPFLPALMFHVSRDVVGVPVTHSPRRVGRSGYTPRKLLRVFGNLIFNNSSLLLRMVGQVGIALALVSLVMAGVVTYRKLAHRVAVSGWASLMVAQLFIGGMLLLGLGVVGEYLLRIIESSEARPTYLVRRRVGSPPPGP
jgi:dolichol-phosphate mannosyltransferase/undecaprenyl-phosphate 4-deoxy-4-formamido-L-arabinose transferase